MVYRAENMPARTRILIPYRFEHKVKPYARAVAEAGMEPVPVLVTESANTAGFAGVVLTGGTDVNPIRYGQTAGPETDAPDDERDEVELRLVKSALDQDLPILAICRGMQILNIAHDGTLIQHLGCIRHDPEAKDVSQPVHEVEIDPDTQLGRIAGECRWRVNSRHHQAVDRVGKGLKVSATDPEAGVVEALERPDRRFVIAVQWHPEDQISASAEQLRLFNALREACGYSSGPGERIG